MADLSFGDVRRLRSAIESWRRDSRSWEDPSDGRVDPGLIFASWVRCWPDNASALGAILQVLDANGLLDGVEYPEDRTTAWGRR